MRRSVRGVPSPWSDLDRPPLSASRLRRALVDTGVWRAVDVVERTESTNAALAAAARRGEDGGLVLLAEEQSSGRGRLDRRWEAPPRACILGSVLLRPVPPPATWPLLPLLAGVAVAEAVRSVGTLAAVLKWPNDVLLSGRKVAGILAERIDGAVVVGIGLNVSVREHELAVPTATSVALEGGVADRESLAKETFRALGRRLAAWTDANGAPEAVLPAYREICDTIGRDVTVELPGGVRVHAHAEGVDDGGRLVVRRTAGGETEALSAGDVVHVTAAG
jgi:BirA family biotin operon repressor/biotin-[acetyl-CoA-carboxylase] ligase